MPLSPEEIAARLAEVRARIEAACQRARRATESVELVAVSKLQPPEAIRAAFAAGQRSFGESYAQELRDKAEALADLPGLRWHAIGPLQLNKVKYVARVAHLFHALDRLEVAQELSRRRSGPPLPCLLEVNLAGESTKHGLRPEQVPALLEALGSIPELKLSVRGLMCLPPYTEEPERSRPHFRSLSALAGSLGLAELSMGTTADYEVAVEEGATLLRVGTAIFGERA